MQNRNHCSLALHLFAFFITFYLYVIQPEVLILFPTAVVYLGYNTDGTSCIMGQKNLYDL